MAKMKKIWVQRTMNYESHIDQGPYGVEENWVPKDMWWEEVEMQEGYKPLNWEAACQATQEPDENGDYRYETK